jgi:hypothetical protein
LARKVSLDRWDTFVQPEAVLPELGELKNKAILSGHLIAVVLVVAVKAPEGGARQSVENHCQGSIVYRDHSEHFIPPRRPSVRSAFHCNSERDAGGRIF